jgi:hypothetical protein
MAASVLGLGRLCLSIMIRGEAIRPGLGGNIGRIAFTGDVVSEPTGPDIEGRVPNCCSSLVEFITGDEVQRDCPELDVAGYVYSFVELFGLATVREMLKRVPEAESVFCTPGKCRSDKRL